MTPLDGLTVLDLTRLLPGPFCAWLLRSWGARVVKVEDPQVGDYLREAEPAWFRHLNAGAESVAIDLKQPKGRALFLSLAASADVVLEGFRPGVLDRLGLGLSTLHAVNPRLVLVSVSGYPADSPLAGRAGHDLTYLARTGILHLMGEVPPIQWVDLAGGLTAAGAALAAVVGARATGQGMHVEASLFDAAGALASLTIAQHQASERAETGREHLMLAGNLPCYTVYEASDGGRVALGALEPKFWRVFCEAVQRPGWVDRQMDPALKADVADLVRSRSLAEWQGLAEQWPDACLETVRPVSVAAADGVGGQPARFGGRRPQAAGPAPERGAHTQEFLRKAGISEQEIALLAAEGVILAGESRGKHLGRE